MRAPRLFARSYSSRTSTAPPSDMMKPLRSLSNGRQACAGSSLRVESAWSAAKEATAIGQIGPSAPPASITSASPCWIMRSAAPMLCRPVAQAETTP